MIRRILLTLFSIFLVWQSAQLIFQIHHFVTNSWILNLILAWVLNLFITGVFAFLVFAHPIENLFPESYYTISHSKKFRKWCKILKVDWFRNALLLTIWRSQKQQKKYFNGRTDGIENLITQSKKSEWGHLMPFILLMGCAVYFTFLGFYLLAVFTTLVNIIGNFYPVLLQRHHRMRIQIIRKRASS